MATTKTDEYYKEAQITCPYCGWKDSNSWEFGEESGECHCLRCYRFFYVEVETELYYSSYKID